MKKLLKCLLLACLTLNLVACSETERVQLKEESDRELIVFAAASMTESFEEIKSLFEKENQEVQILYNFDSSGTLQTQIEEGAACDVFVSAAQKQMNQLEDQDLIDTDTRFDLLENKVVLVVSEDNPAGINSFYDLASGNLESIAIGNEDVPVGQYSQDILENLNIWNKIQGKITYGTNVKEVTTWVQGGLVDCGIVYETDAKEAGLEIVDRADDQLLDEPVIYPAARLESSKNPELAMDFLEFLKTDQAAEVFEKYGFTVLK